MFTGFGSEFRTTTAFREKEGGLGVVCSCFNGTLDEFEAKVKKTHGDSKFGREYLAMIGMIRIHFDVESGKKETQTHENTLQDVT